MAQTERHCIRCGARVTADEQGSWVDTTGGDGCDETVHSVANYTVAVDWYSLDEGRVGQDRKPLARFEHRTLNAARKRLASILYRRSPRTKRAYDKLYHEGRQFYISGPDGGTISLTMATSLTTRRTVAR